MLTEQQLGLFPLIKLTRAAETTFSDRESERESVKTNVQVISLDGMCVCVSELCSGLSVAAIMSR